MKKITTLRFSNSKRKPKPFVLSLLFCLTFVMVLAGFGKNLLPNSITHVLAASQKSELWQEVDERSIPAMGIVR